MVLVGSGCGGGQRPRRNFELRIGAGLAGKELDKIGNAFALVFGPCWEFNSHTVFGMHDANDAFGVDLQAGGAQAQIDPRSLREGRYGLDVATAQTEVGEFTLADWGGLFG